MLREIIIKGIAKYLQRHEDEFILFTATDGVGFGATKLGREDTNLSPVVAEGMSEHPDIRKFVLLCAKEYLCRHEVDRNNFAKEIYETD